MSYTLSLIQTFVGLLIQSGSFEVICSALASEHLDDEVGSKHASYTGAGTCKSASIEAMVGRGGPIWLELMV